MEKEKTKAKHNINSLFKVYYIGKDTAIYLSLRSLSLKSKKFVLVKKVLNKSLSLKKAFMILDDTSEDIRKEITFFKKRKFSNFLILLDKKNISMIEEESFNFFLKPLSIFDLHEELYRRIEVICTISDKWILDRANLKFCGNKNEQVQLTEKEYKFINYLLDNRGNLIEKEYLLKKIWMINLENKIQIKETRVVETLVSRIRKKLSEYSSAPRLIKKKGGYTILI
ncbi:helix-turn-helix domain-containing protein [Pelagibacteraceae bacterium]|nr:helix-turn-helix domain-containing protein [Pelagibacteraceae bacterium]